jgi:hypothetical protein
LLAARACAKSRVLRSLLILATLALALPARAQEPNDTGRWHLAIDASLFTFRRVAAEPQGNATRPGQDVVQFGYTDGVGLRLGYLWLRGWELGALAEVGTWKTSTDSINETSVVRFSPLAYVRYLFDGGRTRAFAGSVFGAELSRYRSHDELQGREGFDPEQTTRTRSFAFGPEGGVRILATDWLSIDPFLRWQVNLGRTTYSQFPGGFDERSWRLLFGFAASFWL